MKTIKLMRDHAVCIASIDGSVVKVRGNRGEDLTVDDDIAALFVKQGAAVELKPARRAVKPRGETRAT